MTATLRPGLSTDAKPLAAILREWIDETPWFRSPHPPASDPLFTLRKIRDGVVTVADTGEPAGFLALEGNYISCLYVAARHRGAGLGRQLLDDAKDRRAALRLWTFQANDRARAFYRREGFAEVQFTDGSENEEGLPDVELRWERSRP
jgi:GNAT superfamily N-acetyltransferase